MNSSWQNTDFCTDYLKNIRVSTDDVHYGYMAPGERELGLLGPRETLLGKRVFEIGCGAAQNCIALSKWGAVCTGTDISPEMLRRAEILEKQERVSITLKGGDARQLTTIVENEKFDIFLSSYAIGFICRDFKDFSSLVSQIRTLANVRAKLVFCLRHPCQNEGVEIEVGDWFECCFTVEEVTTVLREHGFMVKSIVEQATLNPSKLTEAEKQRFPYITLVTDARFDELSHKPHTIIYSAQLV
jgi:SAM-dependent methyltransferase